MNILEAMKSGKPFKKKSDDDWIIKLVECWVDGDDWQGKVILKEKNMSCSHSLLLEDLFREDWMVKEDE